MQSILHSKKWQLNQASDKVNIFFDILRYSQRSIWYFDTLALKEAYYQSSWNPLSTIPLTLPILKSVYWQNNDLENSWNVENDI